MKRKIFLQNQEIVYNLRRRRGSRRLSLSINCDAEVAVTAPHYISVGQLEDFVRSRAEWLLAKIDWFKKNTSGSTKLKGKHQDYLLNKGRAYQLAKSKLEEFNRDYNFVYKKISVRNQKSRWGSCSGHGTLSFSYKIALVPEPLADYVIVHELCHLKEMNHSARFWALVAKKIPDYLERRKALRKIKFT